MPIVLLAIIVFKKLVVVNAGETAAALAGDSSGLKIQPSGNLDSI